LTPGRKLALVVAGGALAIAAISSGGSRLSCSYYGYQAEQTVKYVTFMGCFIKTPTGWIPRKQVMASQ